MITRKATLQDLPQLANLFDQYRTWYHKESDIKGAENFLKERLENQDSEKDWLEKLDKVRKPKEKFITEVK